MASAAAPVEETGSKSEWWASRSKRSQAYPQHSLFGTALESVDKESLNNVEGRYIPEGYIRVPPDRYPLPAHLKARIPGRDTLEMSRKELVHQRQLLTDVDHELQKKAEKAFAFDRHGQRQKTAQSQSSRPSWLSEQDLEHSKDINIVGLTPRGSYNRDKYGRKPPTHNYSLLGNVLAPNMDFSSPRRNQQNEKDYLKGREIGWGPGRHLPYDQMQQSKGQEKSFSQSLVALPPNIRHKFGSRVCDSLLSDEKEVNIALERQRTMSGPPRPSKHRKVESLPVDVTGTYASLGHTTRYNVCPGITTGQDLSQTKSEFNDLVHLRRVPDTDEFRYQRDELSTWAEHNVLRERMKKAWNDAYPLGIWVEQDVLRKRMQEGWKMYFASLPKQTVTWDRSASRPPPSTTKPTPTPKPKVRGKPKSKQQPQKEQAKEEEIVFVTPPLTPPPPVEDRVELPKEFERDDEFWKFFDQPVPK